jgi:hypothetical protein
MSDDPRAVLRAAVRPGETSTLPKGNVQLTYMGHAAVTARLLDADPEWSWEPLAADEHGLPAFDFNGDGYPVGLWIRLTVCGVTRPGYGSVVAGKSDAVKELIGDAIRNAAMRFGVGLELGHKGDLYDTPTEPVFTKTVAKKVAVREIRMATGKEEAEAKKEASSMWSAFGMDALDLTEQLVVEKVGTWLSTEEPFDQVPGSDTPGPVSEKVDEHTGEIAS